MKRAARGAVVLSAALVATSFVVVSTPAQAVACGSANPADAPVFVSTAVSPSSLVIGKGTAKLTVSIRATSVCGITAADITLTPKVKPSSGTIWVKGLTRSSGTANDGTWSATATVSPYLPGGVWEVTQSNLDDSAGNETTHLKSAGTVQLRHSTSTYLKPPPAKVKKGQKVTITGKLTIDGGDYTPNHVDVQTRTTGTHWKTIATLKTGTFGNYSAKYVVNSTKYYRVVHNQHSDTMASYSRAYLVAKK